MNRPPAAVGPNDDVEPAVAVDVPQREGPGRARYAECRTRPQVPLAIVKEDAVRLVDVAAQVPHVAAALPPRRAVGNERDRVERLVANDDVLRSVAVHVADREGARQARTGAEGDRTCEAALAVAKEYPIGLVFPLRGRVEPLAVTVPNDDVGVAVAI